MRNKSNRVALLACLAGSLTLSMQGTVWAQETKPLSLDANVKWTNSGEAAINGKS